MRSSATRAEINWSLFVHNAQRQIRRAASFAMNAAKVLLNQSLPAACKEFQNLLNRHPCWLNPRLYLKVSAAGQLSSSRTFPAIHQ